jgi:hypothetical protein
VTDQYGQRIAANPAGPADAGDIWLSDEAQLYVAQAAALQRQARQDPHLNGEDSRRRLKTNDF